MQFNGSRFLCNCPHFLKNVNDPYFVCKHILAVLKTYGDETHLLKQKIISSKPKPQMGVI